MLIVSGRAAKILEGRGARFWVSAPKGVRGVIPGQILKNVHTIWCIILRLLHKIIHFFLFLFFLFIPFPFSLFLSFVSAGVLGRGGGAADPSPGCATVCLTLILIDLPKELMLLSELLKETSFYVAEMKTLLSFYELKNCL